MVWRDFALPVESLGTFVKLWSLLSNTPAAVLDDELPAGRLAGSPGRPVLLGPAAAPNSGRCPSTAARILSTRELNSGQLRDIIGVSSAAVCSLKRCSSRRPAAMAAALTSPCPAAAGGAVFCMRVFSCLSNGSSGCGMSGPLPSSTSVTLDETVTLTAADRSDVAWVI